MTLRRNILLFHQGALGDFIVTWPLALAMGRVFAQSRVFYVTTAQKGALAERALRVESVDVEGGWHHLFSESPQLPESAARLLDGAQWVINFVADANDRWSQNVKSIAPQAALVSLATTPNLGFSGHITAQLLEQLKPWPVIEAALDQMLKSIANRGMGVLPRVDGPVVLHPGAGSGKKCWPPEMFLELAVRLSSAGRRVQFVLGEVELERWPARQIEQFSMAAEVCRPQTLVGLMDLLTRAAAFVGNDSGPGHLSGILGVPTVSIFGPTDAARWKPLGPRVTVAHGEWERVTAQRVVDAVNALSE